MTPRILMAGVALALAAVVMPSGDDVDDIVYQAGSSDPATVNVQAIVDRLNLYLLTS
ncbi:hypothetical protein SAMN05421505_12453 [Sinosporangium album]|uniref:Uncharacterized protein n=1 Tax=Sinosporangium album TaxID=504805 RepID=A0A1G8FRD0_9ACTN|nr:hypothetical protein [Sinosporangium album]SDH84679.1 hypothetical protein SAMN05421505_12453 [Sinosporangium album]